MMEGYTRTAVYGGLAQAGMGGVFIGGALGVNSTLGAGLGWLEAILAVLMGLAIGLVVAAIVGIVVSALIGVKLVGNLNKSLANLLYWFGAALMVLVYLIGVRVGDSASIEASVWAEVAIGAVVANTIFGAWAGVFGGAVLIARRRLSGF